MLSAICFNLDQSEILSSSNGLYNVRINQQKNNVRINQQKNWKYLCVTYFLQHKGMSLIMFLFTSTLYLGLHSM